MHALVFCEYKTVTSWPIPHGHDVTNEYETVTSWPIPHGHDVTNVLHTIIYSWILQNKPQGRMLLVWEVNIP